MRIIDSDLFPPATLYIVIVGCVLFFVWLLWKGKKK